MKEIFILLFVFSISFTLTAQKQNIPDTSNIDELNMYLDNAVRLRNAGMITTLTGVGIAVVGCISTVIWSATTPMEGWDVLITLVPAAIGIYGGIPVAIIGIPIWAIGGSRKSKAEIAIQKLNILPENTMALGLGITFRF